MVLLCNNQELSCLRFEKRTFIKEYVKKEVFMSTEQGIVKQVEPGWAWVKAKRLGASSGCGRHDHCHTIEGGNKMVIKAANLAQARKGDVVVLYLSTIAGVVAAVVLMRFLANRMAHQEKFTPIVKRIVRPAFEPINLK